MTVPHVTATPASPARLAVFVSGGGSNLEALCEYFAQPAHRERAQVVLVISNKETAGALQRAHARHIATHVCADPSDGEALHAVLSQHRIDVVVLAGYLKLVPPPVIRTWHGRIVNIHPALLPAFGGPGMYGRRVHEAVVSSGARISGATVHFVDEHYDRGAIIAQWPVPVLHTDTAESLSQRVLTVEHQLLPRCVDALVSHRIALSSDGRTLGDVPWPFTPSLP